LSDTADDEIALQRRLEVACEVITRLARRIAINTDLLLAAVA
jgi:hypothetical protein